MNRIIRFILALPFTLVILILTFLNVLVSLAIGGVGYIIQLIMEEEN